MYWRDVGYLCREKETLDKFNRPQKAGFEKREVLCNETGVKRSEFYQAQAVNLKPEIKFVLPDYLDYNDQKEVAYNGFRYKVLRTFRTGNELEIVCYGGVRAEVFENGDS